MAPQNRRTRFLAIRLDAIVVAQLNRFANRSDVIRQAIRARLQVRCPLCDGTGYWPATIPPPTQVNATGDPAR